MAQATRGEISINPISGLREKPNRFFGVPWVEQESVAKLQLGPHLSALHKIPVASGRLSLDFYAQLNPSDYLVVAFHGANSARAYSYPRFERVKSLRQTVPAFLSFADPTLPLSKELELCWYAGGSFYDPLQDIMNVVQEAQEHVGATHVMFIGGSGGGVPALRISAHMEGSTAFTQSTATVIRNSKPESVDKYFRLAWPGEKQEELLERYPHRFDMRRLYADMRPSNRVYMLQNSNDTYYQRKHYTPFKSVYLDQVDSGEAEAGQKLFVLEASERQRHGPPTEKEWDVHFAKALDLMRK